MREPFPWYSSTRSGGGWFVKLNGDQHFLGKQPVGAAKPEKKKGRWNAPSEVLSEFYKLMALRDTASKSDYTFDTICALFLEDREEEDPKLAKRYEPILGAFCDHVYKKRRVGKLLVNAEIDKRHLRSWANTYKSDQTQRTYVTAAKTTVNWAVNRKDINIAQSPFAEMKTPKTRSRDVVITKEEHAALLTFWDNDCFCDFLQAMWFTGARPGEIAKVEQRHIDGGLWRLDATEHKSGRVTGKDRLIGIPDELRTIVERLISENPEGPIFRNTYGRPWTTSASHVRFKNAKNQGIIRPEVVPYAYRHAWATYALSTGNLNEYEVAKALGHQSTQMVLLHYDHSRKNTEHIEDIFRRARK